MKIGIRKPNYKSRIKARTTGKLKRKAKKALIPGYGKKGMGWIKNPKKAAYNKIYNKTTIGTKELFKISSKPSRSTKKNTYKQTSRAANVVVHSSIRNLKALNYNVLAKEKPDIRSSIFWFIVGIITFMFVKFLGIFFFGLGLYAFYDYKKRTTNGDFLSDIELSDFENKVRKYRDDLSNSITIIELTKKTKELLESPYSILTEFINQYDNHPASLTADTYLALIDASNICLDFKQYITCQQISIDRIEEIRTLAMQSYVDNEYLKAMKHAQELKTENGKLNQIQKYKDIVERKLTVLYPDFSSYMESKINLSDFK